MADIIQEITSANNYAGNAGLGGSVKAEIEIDTKPLQNLAYYTMAYNKSEYDQRQKDAEAAAKEIADYTSYDLTSSIEKDRKVLQDGYDEITKFVADNPDALNYKDKKAWGEYRRLRGKLDNDIKAGVVRDTLNKVREKQIADEPNVAEKARLRKKLDEEIAATDIQTPLQHSAKFDVEPVKYKEPARLTFSVIKNFGNLVANTKVNLMDMSDVGQQSNSVMLGLSALTHPQTDLEKQQYEAQSNSGKLEPILSAKNISAVMQAKDVNGNPLYMKGDVFDINAAKNSGNGILAGNVSNVEIYNRKMDDIVSAIKAGAFKDQLGRMVAFGVNGINEADWAKIDLNKGHITPEELGKMAIAGLGNAIVTSETTMQHTGDVLTASQQTETKRHNKAEEGLKGREIDLNEEKWKDSQTGGTTVINGAMEFAKRLYADMQKLTDKNGVISPDKVRQLNSEQLKYLGIEVPAERDAEGNITVQGGYKPLSFTAKDEDGKEKPAPFAIQLINGEVKVLGPDKDGKITPTESGGYRGRFDPTKSTNIYNIATNRLNEENTKAGSKELSPYMGVDVTGGVTSNTDGGSNTQSGSTKTKESQSAEVPAGATVVYKKGTTIPLGYELNGKKYKFK